MKVKNKVFNVAILALFLICVAFLFFCNTSNSSHGQKAVIYVDGVLYEEYYLSDNVPDFTVETCYGFNVISIKDGKIGVIDADCPDRTCVNMGFTDNSAYPVICMPHRLEIVIMNSSYLDGVTG